MTITRIPPPSRTATPSKQADAVAAPTDSGRPGAVLVCAGCGSHYVGDGTRCPECVSWEPLMEQYAALRAMRWQR